MPETEDINSTNYVDPLFRGIAPKPKIEPIPGVAQPAQTNAAPEARPLEVDPFFLPKNQTDPAFEAVRRFNERGNRLTEVEQFIRENQKDLPIDATTGLGFGLRSELSLARTPEDKFGILARRFKPENVRRTADGSDFLVKIPTEEGVKEFKVDELGGGVTSGDVADLLNIVPETIGAGVALKAARVPSILRGLTGLRRAGLDLTATALGAQIEGGITDIGVRASQGRDINLTEIAKSRTAIGAAEVATGAALGVGAKFLMRAPLQTTDRVVINRIDAAKRLEQETGEDLVKYMTVGELTGNRLFKKAESLIGQMPGGRPLQAQRELSDKAISKVQKVIVGGDTSLSDPVEEVGIEALSELQRRGIEVKDALVAAQRNVVDEGTKEALSLLGQKSADPVVGSELANAARETAKFLKGDFTAAKNALYEEAKQLAGGGKPVLVSKSLKTEAKKLLEELPQQRKKAQTGQHSARLQAQARLDEVIERKQALLKIVKEEAKFGSPRPQSEMDELLALSDEANQLKKVLSSIPETLPADVKGQKILHPFVDSKAVSMLESLAETGDQPFALRELIEMGKKIDSEISIGKAIGSTDDRLFTRMRDLIRNATKEGLEGLNDGGKALEAFETANNFYAANRPKFDLPGVADLFKQDFRPDAFFRKLNAGATDEYMNLQKFFGKNSAQMEAIRNGMRNDIFQSAKLDGDMLDASRLLKKLNGMDGLSKAVLRDVVGPHAEELMAVARRVKIAQGKVSAEALENLMNTESKLLGISTINVEGSFKAMVRAQKELDKEFSGRMMKSLAKGEIGDEVIDPADFVQRFYDHASLSEVKKAMTLFSKKDPELAQRVQQKTIENLFLRSRSNVRELPKLSGIATEPLDVGKLQALVPDEAARRKLEAIIGPDTLSIMDNLVDVLQGRPGASGGAGALGSSMVITQAVRQGGALSYMKDYLSFKIASIMISIPLFKKWFSNTLVSEAAQNRLLLTAIASAPFAEALANDMGPVSARSAALEINRGIAAWMEANPQKAEAIDQ